MQTSINERGLISPDLNSYILLAKKYFESKEAFGFALNEAIKNDKSDKPEVKKIIEELTKLQEKCLLDDKVGFKLSL